ncbi:MAG: LamB/YcsF family protein [Pelagibacteraceae bacterium]|jgi:UPF0271 protein|nr:LamB/YcsF family protein [Pelagibacteraceae bacterium]MDP6784899.1 5-oxoprolinase subunit PxpA [Alphaproteobacteria bacterium]MBO6468497.1 LamB/YcsF family protein [Pelagibacteraceae bacterium]MBO6469299.1 LamB/YcsF family protein [Pelagibacteraceae bacterium]MBO6470619.1 LamB/YcsF family protein [Pelagibacteraceae bacterium]|tara:strand:- start:90 stop:863 length:774 start_codon:yes stop_codon:yes gene_type:complete
METNLNCDMGEKSIHYDGKNDEELMKIINTANIACGYHAGNNETMQDSIQLAKENNVSVGAHPGFDDKNNFGRKRINLDKKEIKKLVIDQINVLDEIANEENWKLTHVKPHGALNNMACEDYDLSITIGEAIQECNPDLIYMVLPLTEMENAAKKLNIKFATEIFADRNYDDNGLLLSRDKKNSMLNNVKEAVNNVTRMLESRSIYCYSGKKIACEFDSICIHSDGKLALDIAKSLSKSLIEDGFILKALNKLNKFS